MIGDENEYEEKMIGLNELQRKILLHVLHLFKTRDDLELYLYVMGAGGVGKSVLIKMLFETLARYFNSIPNVDHNSTKILMASFMGTAAFNIRGMTLSSMFSLGFNQEDNEDEFKQLNTEKANELTLAYKDVKLLIVDEVSMCGCKLLYKINTRLKQIFDHTKDFGGISLIVVGDFFQIPPVNDQFIFQCPGRK